MFAISAPETAEPSYYAQFRSAKIAMVCMLLLICLEGRALICYWLQTAAEVDAILDDDENACMIPAHQRPAHDFDSSNTTVASVDVPIPADNIGCVKKLRWRTSCLLALLLHVSAHPRRFKLLQKMGWAGSGLGKLGTGMLLQFTAFEMRSFHIDDPFTLWRRRHCRADPCGVHTIYAWTREADRVRGNVC